MTTLSLRARPPPPAHRRRMTSPAVTRSQLATATTRTVAHDTYRVFTLNYSEDTVFDRQNAVFDALQGAQHFLDEEAALFTGVVDLTVARKRLDDVVASFTTHAFDQDAGSRAAKGETAKQRQIRVKLRREQMRPIAVVAKHNLQSAPEFVALQMPKRSLKGQAFVSSAKGMLDAATAHKDTLLANGLLSTFLDDFQAGLTKLESSISDRTTGTRRRVGATTGLSVEERNGRAVLNVLDAIVEQALAGNEPALSAWKSARHIRRRPGAGNTAPATSTSTSTTPAPAPATTPAGVSAVASSAATPIPVSESKPVSAAA